ncbi:class I SAM-dependent methyltransferase [bacterium]|nr:class I SAM-dependent methyltransferase [bacterium]
MLREGYAVTAEFEENHWWFRSRRDLIFEQVKKAVVDIEHQGKKLNILDYGCGTGYNLRLLAKFGTVTGADINTVAIKEFSKVGNYRYIDLSNNLTPYYGMYDLIVALDVIEHIDYDVQALKDIWKLLRINGELIITVPAYEWLWSGEDIISQHKRRYTKSSLRAAIRDAGYEEIFLSYFNLCILPFMACVIWGKKLLFPKKAIESSVSKTNRFVNWILNRITSIEDTLIGKEKLCLPAGPSLVCRLRKM